MDDLAALSRDLDAAADRVFPEAKQVVAKGCLNIKNDTQRVWRSRLAGGHLQHLAAAVSYDVTSVGGLIVGEVGPVLTRRQGPLGGIAEEGLPDQAPAAPALGPALLKESPRFVDALGDLGERLLDG